MTADQNAENLWNIVTDVQMQTGSLIQHDVLLTLKSVDTNNEAGH